MNLPISGTDAAEGLRVSLVEIVDGLLAANPDVVGTFDATFSGAGDVAAQWIDYALSVQGFEVSALFAASTATVGEVDELAWVTAAQRTQLDSLETTRGDWREWLPHALDERSGTWRETDGDTLVSQLDEFLPVLTVTDGEAVTVFDGARTDDGVGLRVTTSEDSEPASVAQAVASEAVALGRQALNELQADFPDVLVTDEQLVQIIERRIRSRI